MAADRVVADAVARVALVAVVVPVAVALLTGCPPSEPEFSVHVDTAPGGVLLGSWTDGDTVLSVGGHLDGDGALLARSAVGGVEEDAWCFDTNVADRALWWIHGQGDGGGTAGADWYAVGDEGLILRSEGGVTHDESVTTEATLYGVWDDGERVIAVGGDVRGDQLGEVWQRDDSGWTLLVDGLPGVLFKVWQDWIVGDGLIYQLDGDDLVDHTPVDAPKLLTVRGRSADDVWAVGGLASAELWHWDGSNWSKVDVGLRCNQALNGVWTAPGEDIWVAGMFGVMGRYDGTDWECSDPLLTEAHFHGVWPSGDDMLFVGGDLFQPGDNSATVGRWGLGAPTATPSSCP